MQAGTRIARVYLALMYPSSMTLFAGSLALHLQVEIMCSVSTFLWVDLVAENHQFHTQLPKYGAKRDDWDLPFSLIGMLKAETAHE